MKTENETQETKSLENKKPCKILYEEEWTQFQSNIDQEKKNKYDEGKTVGEESTNRKVIRELKEKVGLEYESIKQDDFIAKFKDKVLTDADKNPDEQIKQLNVDIKELREIKIPQLQQENQMLLGQIKTGKIDGSIQKHIPPTLPKGM